MFRLEHALTCIRDKDIDRELENLETRRRELETMRLMTRGQYKDWNEECVPLVLIWLRTVTNMFSSFWRTFVPYSRAWNMRLATMMQTKLPRELRDMVYANLWNEHSLICRHVGSPVRRVAEGSLEVDAAKITTMCDSSVLPHFLGSEYVGQATALEVVLALYKALRGHYAVTVSTQHLHSAFLEDSFLVGFHAYTFLRELSIYCKLDRYRTPPLRHRLARSCQHSDSETLSIDRVKLKADLIVLDSIIDKKNFKLKILLLQRNIRMAVLTESLGVFQGVRETFVEQGAHVQVSWSYDDNIIENYDLYEGHDTVFISIDDYFGMSYSLWERRFKQYIRFVSIFCK